MAARPSEPLLKLIRDAARKKGWNTSTLANEAKLDRSRLKQVLAGREPMTVDELIQLSNAMELGIDDLSGRPDTAPEGAPAPLQLSPLAADAAALPDPFGNHAEQIFRLGFALGCDIFFTADTEHLEGSGVPKTVLSRFDTALPIRLESAFHRHNDPQYSEEGVLLRLSFDAICTCLFPWAAIKQITLYPHAPPEPEPEEEEPETGGKVVHLRLVE